MSPIGDPYRPSSPWMDPAPPCPVTPSLLYPCDKGTGRPSGYHHFVAGPHGTVCTLCGKAPRFGGSEPCCTCPNPEVPSSGCPRHDRGRSRT